MNKSDYRQTKQEANNITAINNDRVIPYTKPIRGTGTWSSGHSCSKNETRTPFERTNTLHCLKKITFFRLSSAKKWSYRTEECGYPSEPSKAVFNRPPVRGREHKKADINVIRCEFFGHPSGDVIHNRKKNNQQRPRHEIPKALPTTHSRDTVKWTNDLVIIRIANRMRGWQDGNRTNRNTMGTYVCLLRESRHFTLRERYTGNNPHSHIRATETDNKYLFHI